MRLFVGGLPFMASSALAATTEVKILVDSDRNVSTGAVADIVVDTSVIPPWRGNLR
jgi:hypothetical protein